MFVFQLDHELELCEKYQLNKLKLPKKSYSSYWFYTNEKAKVAGFGYESVTVKIQNGKLIRDGLSTNKMKFVKTKVMSNVMCRFYRMKPVSDKHLCAKMTQTDPEKPEGLCHVSLFEIYPS